MRRVHDEEPHLSTGHLELYVVGPGAAQDNPLLRPGRPRVRVPDNGNPLNDRAAFTGKRRIRE
ncbi:MAG: hypothetical protein ACREQ9_04690, partial [Candidatus Binatia bacterium]